MPLVRRSLALAAIMAVPGLVLAQTYPDKKDPRSNLAPGRHDAGVAAKNMRLVSNTPKPSELDSTKGGFAYSNSDLAFAGRYVYQGNFSGFQVWDVSDPTTPKLMSTYQCVTSQGDPSIVGNLLFLSAEGAGNRKDCGKGGVKEPSEHMAGIRIFDVSDPAAPRFVKNVETCKGSHTHSLMPSPKDKNILYIYVSGSQGARPATEVPGCKEGTDAADEENSLFRLDVIKVDLRAPEKAEVVTGARIFTGLDPAPRAAGRPARRPRGADSTSPPPMPTGPRNCHDVTIYPAAKLLAGACGSYGLLVDISNPEKPIRIDARSDTNFSLWHTAVFSNDGKKVVFTDEWGGGTSPMCQANSMMEMGGNTILTITKDKKYKQHAYFKIPSVQTAEENCVSHNGGLIPVPGRDIMVQGWYQGGVSVMDFTNADKPTELAFFDRGSVDGPPGVDVPVSPAVAATGGRARASLGGSWGAYYWNGYIYSSEIDRGFDIMELEPSEHLSKNEIEAAKLVQFKEYNPQSQPKIEWPAAFVVVRAYLDQLVRWDGLPAERTTAIGAALDAAEAQEGKVRKDALNKLAKDVDKDIKGAKDPERVKAMSDAIRKLARETKAEGRS